MNSIIGKILLGALVLMCFQNCGNDVGFNEAKSIKDIPVIGAGDDDDDISNDIDIDLDGPEDDDIDVINKKCNNSTPIVASINLKFPNPNVTCDFGNGGNLSPKDRYFRARIEQNQKLNLPAGAVICDAQFQFAQQDYRYDDHFILLFNKSVIAASYDFRGLLEVKNFGLLEYDWTKIANNGAGTFWDTKKEMIYCPDIPGAAATCSFPGHDQQGVININYDSKYIRGIMSNGIPSNHSFSVVSIGDNDNKDCEHWDVEFAVNVSYVK